MTTNPVLPLLEQQHFCQGLPPAQVEKLGALATRVRFEPDEVIFREGDERYEFYLIVSGLVALEIAPPGGQSFRVDTLSAGDELGWSSVLMDKGKLFQARALQPTTALMFAGADLRALCEKDTALGYALMLRLLAVVSERLQATRLQVLDSFWPVAKRAGA